MTRDPKITLDPIDRHRARIIIWKVTGEMPHSAHVEAGPTLVSYGLRARTDSGMHRYLFEGDGNTLPREWNKARLSEVCWQEGCWQKINPAAPTSGDTDNPTAPVWRVCDRHRRSGKVVHLASTPEIVGGSPRLLGLRRLPRGAAVEHGATAGPKGTP